MQQQMVGVVLAEIHVNG